MDRRSFLTRKMKLNCSSVMEGSMKRLLTAFLILAGLLSLTGTFAPRTHATTALASSPRLAVFMEYLDPG